MKKHSIIVLTLLAGCFTNSFAQKGEKTLTVEVSNEWNQNKTDEPIVIDLNNLKAGFNIKSATVWEGNKEIPSQLDDLNGDARADELAFLIERFGSGSHPQAGSKRLPGNSCDRQRWQ